MCPFYVLAASYGVEAAQQPQQEQQLLPSNQLNGFWPIENPDEVAGSSGAQRHNSNGIWHDGNAGWRVEASVRNWQELERRERVQQTERLAQMGKRRRGKSPPKYGRFDEFMGGSGSGSGSEGKSPAFFGKFLGAILVWSISFPASQNHWGKSPKIQQNYLPPFFCRLR